MIYDIQCPICKEHYFGKTKLCFVTIFEEYGIRYDKEMFQHLKFFNSFEES